MEQTTKLANTPFIKPAMGFISSATSIQFNIIHPRDILLSGFPN
jgi:hypothetical protein